MSKAKTGFALTLSNNDTFAKKKKKKKVPFSTLAIG